MADRVESFFEELGRRGHDPLFNRLTTTGRFEVTDGSDIERWMVRVKDGYVSTSRGDGEVDWVMRAERSTFEQLADGQASALDSLLRGTLSVTLIDESQRFSMLTRFFAGPPESRTETVGQRAARQAPLAGVARAAGQDQPTEETAPAAGEAAPPTEEIQPEQSA